MEMEKIKNDDYPLDMELIEKLKRTQFIGKELLDLLQSAQKVVFVPQQVPKDIIEL